MSDRIGSLRLDQNTSPERLGAFLAREGALTKVRGEANSDGSVTLFTTNRVTGWWGELTGLSRERETARAALDCWFRFQLGPELSPEAKEVLDTRIGAGEVDVLSVRQLAGEVQELSRPPEPPPRPYQPTVTRNWVKTDDALTLNGQAYRFDSLRELGRGGFGTVYEGVSETGEKVAIKIAIRKDRSEKVEHEFRAHERAAGGTDPSHIVGLKGAATGPNGAIQAIVVEHMPGGDANNMLMRLRAAEREGRISSDQARLIRLTAAKDMAIGLSQLHEDRSLLHYDVKPANFLISGDGVVKLSDFGTTRPEEEMHGEALVETTTPVFMSPELNRAQQRFGENRMEIRRLNTRAEERGFTKDALSDLARSQKLQRELDSMSLESKSDVFSLGLSFANAFEGKHLQGQYMQLYARIEALGTGARSERNRVLDELGVRGNNPEHKLIRAMLAGDPGKRPTAREVANSPPLDEPGVGSEEARKLMLDVAQGKYDAPRGGRR